MKSTALCSFIFLVTLISSVVHARYFQPWKASHQRRLKDLSGNFVKATDSSDTGGFQLIAYLHPAYEETYCVGIRKAIHANNNLSAIAQIHLFRHNTSCLNDLDLTKEGLDTKVVIHNIVDKNNMTFEDLMNFITSECYGKNILFAKANMYFSSDVDLYLKDMELGFVHVLKSMHPVQESMFYGNHYAFAFKGQWDTTYRTFDTIGMDFILDSHRFDNENVMKKIFETKLDLVLKHSNVKSYPICYH